MAIVYEGTVLKFKSDVLYNKLTDQLIKTLTELHLGGGIDSQIGAWQNSLSRMRDVLEIAQTPDDCKVAIEYNIPQTCKRVDFMILGSDNQNRNNVVIIELKQWAKVEKVGDVYEHSVMSDLRSHQPVAHPSYQAYTYKALIQNYADRANLAPTNLAPCAYLHNLGDGYRLVIEDPIYKEWLNEAPAFLRNDAVKLCDFIKKYITKKSSDEQLLYKIDYGRIKPQKSLQDCLDSMLCGNDEFKMIDDQVVAFDKIMDSIKKAKDDNKKHVVIIRGGPGTGKSVLAINLLAKCISKLGLNAAYITKNMAPRHCYARLLSKGNAKKAINLEFVIQSPHGLVDLSYHPLDVGIFDEAHRMQQKPWRYPGKDMLYDAIRASRISVFFIDEDQRISAKDCYDVDAIKKAAKDLGCVLDTEEPFELTSQFRCGGSDGYIAFLNDVLGIAPSANQTFDLSGLDIRVFDNPNEMRDELRKINEINNKARMVAGYCYDWNVKYHRDEYDVIIGDFKAKWNLEKDDVWAVNPKSFEEVGCIHTCQGMEFDYAGVFIGKDLKYVDGKVVTDKWSISKDDKSSGIRGCKNEVLADRLIRNTYKVLLTRGLKGCFIYCEDKALSEYLKKRLGSNRN